MSTHSQIVSALRAISNPSGEDNLQLVHGFVSAYHAVEGELGSFDFISSDGTICIHDVKLSSVYRSVKGAVLVPPLHSDVTLLWSGGTSDAVIIAYSHVDIVHLESNKEVRIGVTGQETNPDADYDEQQPNGEQTQSVYSPDRIVMKATKEDSASQVSICAEGIVCENDQTKTEQTGSEIKVSAGGSVVEMQDASIELDSASILLGKEANEPAVLGEQLASLMRDFLLECSKITVSTMLGTMPILNMGNFQPLMGRLNEFLSQNVKVK